MKYSEIDLQCEDILWVGVDDNDNIMAFTSGGYGNVPDFVCSSREETKQLEEFFMTVLAPSSVGHLLIDKSVSPLSEDSLILAQKGLFCFDVSFNSDHDRDYEKIAYPETPITLQQLPDPIKSILSSHRLEANAGQDSFIKVVHAY